ncbi:dienelactone hydrolase family protein [soil metagenome]
MMDPHQGQPVLSSGSTLGEARAAMILVHGRGADARDILELAEEFPNPAFAYLAPQAAGRTWYPYSFLSPLEQNEPHLSSALRLLGVVVQQVIDAGIPHDRLILLGFSQGACLCTEFAARNARRYGGVVALTGGLIGPDDTPRDYPGAFDGTPIFLGSSDPDPHIPVSRVDETERVLQHMGAEVTKRIYPGMGHTVSQDELIHVRRIMGLLET